MSFMDINAFSYALQTVYHDIDTTTLVLDVLFYFLFFLILIIENFTASRKMFKFIYIYIFQNKVKLSSSKNIFGTLM